MITGNSPRPERNTAALPDTGRRHDIDALRSLAFLLLILYHVGMFYVSWGWHVKSAYSAAWLEPVMTLVNQWRMPLIFLISGLAVNFLLGEGKQPKIPYARFAWLRTKRLLWPLLFGMFLIVPPQAYLEALTNEVVEPGYLAFLQRYFAFSPWPEDAFAGSDPGITWNHLWYLPYLWLYTFLIIPVALWINGRGRVLRLHFQALRGIGLVLVPVLWLMPIGLWVFPLFPYIKHDLVGDGYAHAMYGSFFLFGYLIGRSPGLWQEFARLRWPLTALAWLTYAGLMALSEVLDSDPGFRERLLQSFVVYLNRWAWIMVVLGWGHRLLNRPMRWLSYANRAVFPWYVLHQSITVVAGYYLSVLALGPVLEPVLLIVITMGGCALGMYLFERWLPWLAPAIGLKAGRGASRDSSGELQPTAHG